MVALFRIAALSSIVAMSLSAQVRRNEQPRPPSMTLDEYEPTSMLVVPATTLLKARFPFVDVHDTRTCRCRTISWPRW